MDNNIFSSKDVVKTYSFYAPIYDFLFGAVLEPGRRALCAEVRQLNPNRILEIGVGTGLLLSQYPITSQITGIDISKEMLDIANDRVGKLPHLSIHLELMDAEKLSFIDDSFDCVVLPYVLSVTPNPNDLIKEALRVCKKDGMLIIVNHFSGSGAWYLLEKLVRSFAQKIGFRSEFSYDAYIVKNDLDVVKLKQVNIFGLSKLIVIKNK
jgi:phosphatidylethanolamine/phosphatidyl-N-methylethanolamine N-methyltransferase